MKQSLILLFLANSLLSCQQSKNYSEQIPKCNDSIPVKLATELSKRKVASIVLANATNSEESSWSRMVEDYQAGKRFDPTTDEQIEIALNIAKSFDFQIKDIREVNIDEQLKKCDCETSLKTKTEKIPFYYSAQNKDGATYVTLQEK